MARASNIEIDQERDGSYVVSVWLNGWRRVSRHKHKADAEEIFKAIESGCSSDNIRSLLALQDQECNTLLLDKADNWS